MQLWKKNFLATFFMFLLIIQGGLFMLHGFLYQNELKQWRIEAVAGERMLLSIINELDHTDKVELVKSKGSTYLLISDSIEKDNHQIALTYMESMRTLQQNKENRIRTILGI